MSRFIYITCSSGDAMTRRRIAEFVDEGAYFDADARFVPPADAPESAAVQWDSMQIHHQSDKKPIVLRRLGDEPDVQEVVEEALEELDPEQDVEQARLAERLRDTRQVLVIELDPTSMTDDSWEMLDSLEGFVAQKLDGIVFAPDDGFYDQKLQPIYKV